MVLTIKRPVAEQIYKQSKSSEDTSLPLYEGEQVKIEKLSSVPTLNTVLEEFRSSKEWRTAWGIAQSIHYSEDAIAIVLKENSDLFEVSPLAPAGISLYRPRT